MLKIFRSLILVLTAAILPACSMAGMPAFKGAPMFANAKPVEKKQVAEALPEPEPSLVLSYSGGGRSDMSGLISKYAFMYGVPETLVHRMVKKESNYNPSARNGPYYGLMQISHATAISMGYDGKAAGLLNPDTNLRYAVKYLAGAYKVARGNQDQAVRFYQRGYYYDAKRAGMLKAVGL